MTPIRFSNRRDNVTSKTMDTPSSTHVQMNALTHYPWVVAHMAFTGDVIANESGIFDVETLRPVYASKLFPPCTFFLTRRGFRRMRDFARGSSTACDGKWNDATVDCEVSPDESWVIVGEGGTTVVGEDGILEL